ncbi:MAG: PQQ-like beta-propeller repeat protein, partial [Bacteroidetes bacterium]|nr:PQQ-like beta-propeller repeat protein [Bacteroidota bacterium]
MKSLIKYLYILLFLLASCEKEQIVDSITDDNGVYIKLSFKWSSSLHSSGVFHSNSFFSVPIRYGENIALPTTDINGKRFMSLINFETGSIIWSWNDLFDYTENSYLDISHAFLRNDLIVWQKGNNSYCIDLKTGITKWKIKRDSWYAERLLPLENNYLTFTFYTEDSGFDNVVAYAGDIENGNLTEFLKANLSGEYVAPITNNGSIGGISYINEIVNTDYLLVTYAEPLPEWAVRSMFGLYNTETQEWVYERVILKEPHWTTSVFHTPIIYNDKAYANVGTSIVCHEVMTGNQKWRRDFPNDFLFSGFIIEDGMLIALCEDGKLYRLNPETGGVVWTGEGAGTSSRMSYMNGVVYFVG